jgi:16S rRNA (adenine1518-N6/adenine1519-N6)-dimethyltransferase
MVDHVQTRREIEGLLRSAGLRPRKRFGQHFLIDGNLMRRLVDSAEIEPEDTILEVGPGTGGLTDLLAVRARRVVAVELDRDLHALLQERFRNAPHVELICGDVLRRKHEVSPHVTDRLSRVESTVTGDIKLVANLPYHVATPLILNVLIHHPQVRRLCFTVQAEVGERMIAQPPSKAFGPLAVVTQLLCRVAPLARIPPEAFWPRPAVDSVMLRLDVGEPPFEPPAALRAFAGFVRGVFEHRRKTMRAALGYVVDADTRDRLCDEIDGRRRAETLAVDEWVALFRRFNIEER